MTARNKAKVEVRSKPRILSIFPSRSFSLTLSPECSPLSLAVAIVQYFFASERYKKRVLSESGLRV